MRKLELKDVDFMYECLTDVSVTKYMKLQEKSITKENCKNFIKNSMTKENINFAITNCKDEWVGTVSLKNINYVDKCAEFAIISNPKIHGSGLNFDATKEILRYRFYDLQLNRVYLNVLKDNLRANHFYEKVGFVYEGCFRKAICINSSYFDLNWYSILKNEFLNG